MSGVEIAIPVIAAVFALVSAFKDGGAIAEKIKERRERKGVLPPHAKLQRVLLQGAQEIEVTQREGIDEFGEAFKRDAITAGKIKDITIVLQDAIIKQLAAAYENDEMNDFSPVINSIVHARQEAVNILTRHHMELHQRQNQGLPLMYTSPPMIGPGSPMMSSPRPFDGTKRVETLMSDVSISGTSPQGRSTFRADTMLSDASQSPPPRQRTGSWLKFKKRKSVDIGTQQPQQPQQRQLQSPPSSNMTSPENLEPPNQTGTSLSVTRSPPSYIGLPSPIMHRTSTAGSITSPLVPGTELTPITEANKFLGLCKGAYHAQNYNLKKSMEPSMREFEWMYHCRKCKFRLSADSSQRGNPHFDDRIQTSSSTVNFRCLFLWKCHVPTPDVHKRMYKCPFCLLGRGKSKVYAGEDQLFGHISQHVGETLGDVTVKGMIEIQADSIQNTTIEGFDLYFPLEMSERNEKRRGSLAGSFMLPESAIGGVTGFSSIMGNNSINEGLRAVDFSQQHHAQHHQNRHSQMSMSLSPSTSLSPSPRETQGEFSSASYAPSVHHYGRTSPIPQNQNYHQQQQQQQQQQHFPNQTSATSMNNTSEDLYENMWRNERPTRFAELDSRNQTPPTLFSELDDTSTARNRR